MIKSLVRDFRSGPDWVPAIIFELLGPLTYVVETDRGQHWKRHVDQIKSWMNRYVTESNADSNAVNSELGFVPDESQSDTSLNLPEVDDQLGTDDSATNEN